jgi:hypothetical protein
MHGLSLRAVAVSLVTQTIILLYLFDQPETSTVILVSGSIGLAIEAWKLARAAALALEWGPAAPVGAAVLGRLAPCLPQPRVAAGTDYTATTNEHDRLAFRYLGRVLAPLFLCYTLYSLAYKEHTGWYSFVISTLAGGVYTFGWF